jgi:hypothetical protein
MQILDGDVVVTDLKLWHCIRQIADHERVLLVNHEPHLRPFDNGQSNNCHNEGQGRNEDLERVRCFHGRKVGKIEHGHQSQVVRYEPSSR